MAGDLDLAGNDLLTTNLMLTEFDSSTFYVRNRANTAMKDLAAGILYANTYRFFGTLGEIKGRYVNDSYYIFYGIRNGVGDVEVGRVTGGVSPLPDWAISRAGHFTFLADKKIAFTESTELTISGGVITVVGVNNIVDTEGDAASDLLDTINGGSDGMLIVLRAANDARTVTVKDGTGNLALAGDFDLDALADSITLIYDSTNSVWVEICRSNNA